MTHDEAGVRWAPRRYAIVTRRDITPEMVAAYLPGNYRVEGSTSHGVVISGVDDHGWTLDRYVAPRLGSGLMGCWEVDLSHPCMQEIELA